MVTYPPDGIYLVVTIFDDADDIGIKLLLPGGRDKASTAFYGENHMDKELRIGVGHGVFIKRKPLRGRVLMNYLFFY